MLTDDEEKLRAAEFWDYEARMRRLVRRYYGSNVTLRSGIAPTDLRARLDAYFAGTLDALDAIEIQTMGTTFQRAVWDGLRRIPPGQTLTYGQLATFIDRPRAIRAVGHANGCNPIGLVVPCHRVMGANAKLTGYAGGLQRKHWLLVHEGALPADTPPPLPEGES